MIIFQGECFACEQHRFDCRRFGNDRNSVLPRLHNAHRLRRRIRLINWYVI